MQTVTTKIVDYSALANCTLAVLIYCQTYMYVICMYIPIHRSLSTLLLQSPIQSSDTFFLFLSLFYIRCTVIQLCIVFESVFFRFALHRLPIFSFCMLLFL